MLQRRYLRVGRIVIGFSGVFTVDGLNLLGLLEFQLLLLFAEGDNAAISFMDLNEGSSFFLIPLFINLRFESIGVHGFGKFAVPPSQFQIGAVLLEVQ